MCVCVYVCECVCERAQMSVNGFFVRSARLGFQTLVGAWQCGKCTMNLASGTLVACILASSIKCCILGFTSVARKNKHDERSLNIHGMICTCTGPFYSTI